MKKVKKKKSTGNCHFFSREKSLNIAWACFRNDFTKIRVIHVILCVTSDVCIFYQIRVTLCCLPPF